MARQAGFESRSALIAELSKYPDGRLYRIGVRLTGADPRVALRENAGLSDDEAEQLEQKLAAMGARSKDGPWAMAILKRISDYDAFKALVGKGAGRAGGAAPGAQGSPPPSVMADVVLGACDVVTLIHKNFRPDPTAPGSFYEAFAWDTFRVRNGKLVEHWDGATLPAADAGRAGA